VADPRLDLALAVVLGCALLCAAVGVPLARSERWVRWEKRWGGRWLEGGMVALCLGCSAWLTLGLLRVRNPDLLPLCNDLQEYLGYVTRFVDPEYGRLSAYRYPLQPALAAQVCELWGLTPARGMVVVAVGAALGVPLALYALGRQLAPRPVALAGALLVVAAPSWIAMLGRPSDYMLSGLLQVLVLAAVVAALLRPGPWRALLAGVALAVFMASTPKALTLLLLALPALLAALLIRHPRRPALLVGSLLALLAPLALCWWAFSTVDWELRSLEHATIRVLEYAWHDVGYPISKADFPEVGRGEAVEGFWVVGQLEALRRLPDTLRFLLHVPVVAPEAFHGRALLEQALRAGVGLGSMAWLLLVVPAVAAMGVRRTQGWKGWAYGALAAGFLGLALATQVRSLTLILPEERYLIALVMVLPLLMLVGAVALLRLALPAVRSAQLLWLPVLLLVLGLLGRSGGPVGLSSRAVLADQHRVSAMHRVFFEDLGSLSGVVAPADQVVDYTPGGLAVASLLGEHPSLQWRPLILRLDHTEAFTPVPANPNGRRFVVDTCDTMSPHEYEYQWGRASGPFAHDRRFVRRGTCIYEDTQPELPLAL